MDQVPEAEKDMVPEAEKEMETCTYTVTEWKGTTTDRLDTSVRHAQVIVPLTFCASFRLICRCYAVWLVQSSCKQFRHVRRRFEFCFDLADYDAQLEHSGAPKSSACAGAGCWILQTHRAIACAPESTPGIANYLALKMLGPKSKWRVVISVGAKT